MAPDAAAGPNGAGAAPNALRLQLPAPTAAHDGHYECVARNALGSASATATVRVRCECGGRAGLRGGCREGIWGCGVGVGWGCRDGIWGGCGVGL